MPTVPCSLDSAASSEARPGRTAALGSSNNSATTHGYDSFEDAFAQPLTSGSTVDSSLSFRGTTLVATSADWDASPSTAITVVPEPAVAAVVGAASLACVAGGWAMTTRARL